MYQSFQTALRLLSFINTPFSLRDTALFLGMNQELPESMYKIMFVCANVYDPQVKKTAVLGKT